MFLTSRMNKNSIHKLSGNACAMEGWQDIQLPELNRISREDRWMSLSLQD